MLNHKPEDHIDLTNTIMAPNMPEKMKTTAVPKVNEWGGGKKKEGRKERRPDEKWTRGKGKQKEEEEEEEE